MTFLSSAGFVCFGQHLMIESDDRVKELVAYQKRVLTAVGIMHGPSHGEVKWHQDAPVLVEVGARCHGAEGFWATVSDEVLGYNQIDSTIDVFTDPAGFTSLPPVPMERKAHGGLKFVVSFDSGTLRGIHPKALAEIQSMPSYRGHQLFVEAGDQVSLSYILD